MNKKLTHLAQRREHLVALAAAQRTKLTQNMEPWRARLALADRGVAVYQTIRRHPSLLLGAALAIALLRKQPAGKWLSRGWAIWQISRKLLSRGAPKPPISK